MGLGESVRHLLSYGSGFARVRSDGGRSEERAEPILSPVSVQAVLSELVVGGRLSAERTRALFESMFAGELGAAEIAGVLSLIQTRGATVDELVGAARAMRAHVTAVPARHAPEAPILDTAGTGGTAKTFNVSTAAAIVVAAAAPSRLRVAKHGNRSRTGRGSAEVMARLGIDVDAPPEVQGRCLDELGVCFCFAIHHHPAARHAAPVRKALGFPTIFNLLGPLTNPAGAARQVMGVYADRWVGPVAEALVQLGAERAMVLHSEDGLDEISLGAPTRIAHVRASRVEEERIDPADLGLARAQVEDVAASTLEEAAEAIRGVLRREPGPRRDMVLVNAAAALIVGGAAEDWRSGVGLAAEAIDSGRAGETLDRLGALSRERG